MNALGFIEPAFVLILFFILHLLVGAVLPFRPASRPFFWSLMESAGAEIERRLNREGRDPAAIAVRGFITVIIMGLFAYMIGYAFDRLADHSFGWAGQVLALAGCLSVMPTLKLLQAVTRALNDKDVKKAAALLQPFCRDDLSRADSHTCVRRALELSALRLNQYLMAPALFFLLAGAQGLFVYVGLTALFNAFGASRLFGVAIRAAQRVIDFVPALFTVLLIALGALFVSRSNPFRALKTAAAQASRDAVRSRGWLLGTLAGGLGVTLGGIDGQGWIGPEGATAKASLEDLRRGAMLHFVVFICCLLAVSLYLAMPLLAVME